MEPLSRTTSDNLQSLVVNQDFEIPGYLYNLTLGSDGLTIICSVRKAEEDQIISIPWPALQAFSACFRETILAYARHKEAASAKPE